MAAQDVEVDQAIPGTQHFSAQVGDQMRVAATVALGVALLAILLYVAARFEFVYGLGAIIALFHDVLITVGLLAVFWSAYRPDRGRSAADHHRLLAQRYDRGL